MITDKELIKIGFNKDESGMFDMVFRTNGLLHLQMMQNDNGYRAILVSRQSGKEQGRINIGNCDSILKVYKIIDVLTIFEI